MQKGEVLRHIAETFGLGTATEWDIESQKTHDLEAQVICLQIEAMWVPEDEDAITIEDLHVLEAMIRDMLIVEAAAVAVNLTNDAMEDLRAISEQVSKYADSTERDHPDLDSIAQMLEELRGELALDVC